MRSTSVTNLVVEKCCLANTILPRVAFAVLEALAAFTAKFATAMENRLHMQAS